MKTWHLVVVVSIVVAAAYFFIFKVKKPATEPANRTASLFGPTAVVPPAGAPQRLPPVQSSFGTAIIPVVDYTVKRLLDKAFS